MKSFKQYLNENDDSPVELRIPISLDPDRSIAILLNSFRKNADGSIDKASFKVIYTDNNDVDIDSPVEGPEDDIIISDDDDPYYFKPETLWPTGQIDDIKEGFNIKTIVNKLKNNKKITNIVKKYSNQTTAKLASVLITLPVIKSLLQLTPDKMIKAGMIADALKTTILGEDKEYLKTKNEQVHYGEAEHFWNIDLPYGPWLKGFKQTLADLKIEQDKFQQQADELFPYPLQSTTFGMYIPSPVVTRAKGFDNTTWDLA